MQEEQQIGNVYKSRRSQWKLENQSEKESKEKAEQIQLQHQVLTRISETNNVKASRQKDTLLGSESRKKWMESQNKENIQTPSHEHTIKQDMPVPVKRNLPQFSQRKVYSELPPILKNFSREPIQLSSNQQDQEVIPEEPIKVRRRQTFSLSWDTKASIFALTLYVLWVYFYVLKHEFPFSLN